MTLIVEDGTGLATAESYATVAQADAYHAAMGNTAWASLATAAKEVALRLASQYMTVLYQWRGNKFNLDQALAYPRDFAVWPQQPIINACAELALKSTQGALVADEDAASVRSVTVGPISTTFNDVKRSGQKRYVVADQLLKPYVYSAKAVRVERA